MPIVNLDHAALPTYQPDALAGFYSALGFRVIGGTSLREGHARSIAFVLRSTKLNVHLPGTWNDPSFWLRAPYAVPGCADLCFRFEGTPQEAIGTLTGAGATIVAGPVERIGGAGLGVSVYGRDPDENLIELITYPTR